MDHFTIPCAMRIDTKGVLDIPAEAEVVVNDNGEYAGYVTADGDVFAHRCAPDQLMAYIGSQDHEAAPAEAPAPAEDSQVTITPASGPTAEALSEDTPVEETADGQTDNQQA